MMYNEEKDDTCFVYIFDFVILLFINLNSLL